MTKSATIYKKEMMEVLRDRKTLMFMIVLPTVVMPLLFNFLLDFTKKQQEKSRTETIEVALINGEQLPELTALFEENESFEVVPGFTDPEAFIPAIKEKRIKVGLHVPAEAGDLIANNQQVNINAYYDNASSTSQVIPRTRRVLDSFSEEVRDRRFNDLGVMSSFRREAILSPATLEEVGVADERETWGERIGGLLPYLFIAFCFLGAFYPAIDIAAGEKERGTLETLLLTPVPRNHLVIGKFLVVFTSALVAALLCVASMGGFFALQSEGSGVVFEILKSIQPLDYVMMVLAIMPMAAVFACVLLSISIYAKSFKEAQSYMAPMQFLCILPAFVAMLPGVELTMGWSLVPVTNVSLAIKEIVKGTIDYGYLGVIFLSTTLFAAAALAFCTRWFKKESVLFRN
jgi:sodium transport system permease protein